MIGGQLQTKHPGWSHLIAFPATACIFCILLSLCRAFSFLTLVYLGTEAQIKFNVSFQSPAAVESSSLSGCTYTYVSAKERDLYWQQTFILQVLAFPCKSLPLRYKGQPIHKPVLFAAESTMLSIQHKQIIKQPQRDILSYTPSSHAFTPNISPQMQGETWRGLYFHTCPLGSM